jgi:hypothetical protein
MGKFTIVVVRAQEVWWSRAYQAWSSFSGLQAKAILKGGTGAFKRIKKNNCTKCSNV